MRCKKCSTKAVIGLPRHNAAFCKPCFTTFVHDQVARAIKSEQMFGREDRILVAVSGGKDSLALWDKELLRDLNLLPEAYLVIRGDELVTEDETLKDSDEVEVRPVISGGSVQGESP